MKIRYLKCSCITYDVAEKISDIGSCLNWLSMENESHTDIGMDDGCIVEIMAGCFSLRTLNLSFNKEISDITLKSIGDSCPFLVDLNLNY